MRRLENHPSTPSFLYSEAKSASLIAKLKGEVWLTSGFLGLVRAKIGCFLLGMWHELVCI
jgi:hypothetical protein